MLNLLAQKMAQIDCQDFENGTVFANASLVKKTAGVDSLHWLGAGERVGGPCGIFHGI
jgi:hypothetical protein